MAEGRAVVEVGVVAEAEVLDEAEVQVVAGDRVVGEV